MELIVALLMVGGIGGTLSIPYLTYRKYIKRVNRVSNNNDIEVLNVSLDELYKMCSDSFDIQHWHIGYRQSRVNNFGAGYEPKKSIIDYKSRIVIINDKILLVSFDDFTELVKWHGDWVNEGLLASWHKQYKESQK